MLQDIGERLLVYPKQCHFGFLVQSWNRVLRLDKYADAGPSRKLLTVRFQRYSESVIVENQGAERAGHVPHDFHRTFDQRDGIVQSGANFSSRSRRQLFLDDVQVEIDRSEILPETIVQFCRQVAPLRFLDVDDALRYGLQLLGMNPCFGLGALACRNVDYSSARVNKRSAAISRCSNPQERVKHRPVFAEQLDLDL